MALLYTADQWVVVLGILAIGVALKAMLVLWLHRDVQATGQNAWPWTVAGIFAFIPTAIVWRVKRPAPAPAPAPPARTTRAPEAVPGGPDPFRVGLRSPVADATPEPGAVRAALADPTPPSSARPTARVLCPHCETRFETVRAPDGRVTCPSCGASGRV